MCYEGLESEMYVILVNCCVLFELTEKLPLEEELPHTHPSMFVLQYLKMSHPKFLLDVLSAQFVLSTMYPSFSTYSFTLACHILNKFIIQNQMYGYKIEKRDWKDGSEFKSTGCSSRGPEFDSQQPHGGSQPSVKRSGALFCSVSIHGGRMLYTQ